MKNPLKILTLFNIFISLVVLSHQAKGETSPEEENKVFRCNLDERPRILVAILGSVALAYDTDQCALWKAWAIGEKGAVNFTGAVYNGYHGPQPLSIGKKFFELDDTHWKMAGARLQFHSFSPENFTVTYKLIRADNTAVFIKEQPTVSGDELIRKISIKGLKTGELATLDLQDRVSWNLATLKIDKLSFSKNGTISLKTKLK